MTRGRVTPVPRTTLGCDLETPVLGVALNLGLVGLAALARLRVGVLRVGRLQLLVDRKSVMPAVALNLGLVGLAALARLRVGVLRVRRLQLLVDRKSVMPAVALDLGLVRGVDVLVAHLCLPLLRGVLHGACSMGLARGRVARAADTWTVTAVTPGAVRVDRAIPADERAPTRLEPSRRPIALLSPLLTAGTLTFESGNMRLCETHGLV